ncbi:unnamed protein product [Vitrella brassicaformis CCMP3155]|uniref:Uncharacterized protein n=1 Tax=Vitrella brassicaformis (strain CCMP3155) TaxID=1169540 RepID=A0A0G4F1S8_VITBC|nr:unnamed protein product [Vitrella brassicaformis CCMP3155]|eukprot:CEM05561.1 unnamed protein product [Vitrella brassicaformis CCMP3155]
MDSDAASPQPPQGGGDVVMTDGSSAPAAGGGGGGAAAASSERQVQLDGIDIWFPPNTTEASKQLTIRLMRRTIGRKGIRRLIRKEGADPNLVIRILPKGVAASEVARISVVSILALAIDDPHGAVPFMWVVDPKPDGQEHPREERLMMLPTWPTRQIQMDVLEALIAGGPIGVGMWSANLEAVIELLRSDVAVDGDWLAFMPRRTGVLEKRLDHDYLVHVLAVHQELLEAHPELATEVDQEQCNPAHRLSMINPLPLDGFTHALLDLLSSCGTDLTAANAEGKSPLDVAVSAASLMVFVLCETLAVAEVDRPSPVTNFTPLSLAALYLAGDSEHDYDNIVFKKVLIHRRKNIIRRLLIRGASIANMPNATQEDRERRALAKKEYVVVLNELPFVVMDRVNKALAPQRDAAILMARILPLVEHNDEAPSLPHPPSPSPLSFGPQESAAIAWHIGAFLHEPETINAVFVMKDDTPKGRRLLGVMRHFVTSAATRTSGNREVCGGVIEREDGRQVRIPQLQCFVLGGVDGRRVGLREVVHKLRLDEVRRFGLSGVVKGFNNEAGDEGCVFDWGQLGFVDKEGRFQSLGIQ